MIGALVAALAKVVPALAAKLTTAGIASGVVIYKAVKPTRSKKR